MNEIANGNGKGKPSRPGHREICVGQMSSFFIAAATWRRCGIALTFQLHLLSPFAD
jgi:hypothetical protein